MGLRKKAGSLKDLELKNPVWLNLMWEVESGRKWALRSKWGKIMLYLRSNAQWFGFVTQKISNAKGLSTWEKCPYFYFGMVAVAMVKRFYWKGARLEKIFQRGRLLPPGCCSADREKKKVKVIQEVELEGLCLIRCWQWIEGNVLSVAHKVNGDTINQTRDYRTKRRKRKRKLKNEVELC